MKRTAKCGKFRECTYFDDVENNLLKCVECGQLWTTNENNTLFTIDGRIHA